MTTTVSLFPVTGWKKVFDVILWGDTIFIPYKSHPSRVLRLEKWCGSPTTRLIDLLFSFWVSNFLSRGWISIWFPTGLKMKEYDQTQVDSKSQILCTGKSRIVVSIYSTFLLRV